MSGLETKINQTSNVLRHRPNLLPLELDMENDAPACPSDVKDVEDQSANLDANRTETVPAAHQWHIVGKQPVDPFTTAPSPEKKLKLELDFVTTSPSFGRICRMNDPISNLDGRTGTDEGLRRLLATSSLLMVDVAEMMRDWVDSEVRDEAYQTEPTTLENWVKVRNAAGVYFMNTATGSTSLSEPKESSRLFKFRARYRDLPKVNVDRLDLVNEFWVQHRQPLNISKSTGNSFRFCLDARRQYKFDRDVFKDMQVISQIDKRFIGCLTGSATEPDGNCLILIDQHAAHERVCLEKLIQGIYLTSSPCNLERIATVLSLDFLLPTIAVHSYTEGGGEIRIRSRPLAAPIDLSFSCQQMAVIRSADLELQRLGLKLTVKNDQSTVVVHHAPACFLERELGQVIAI